MSENLLRKNTAKYPILTKKIQILPEPDNCSDPPLIILKYCVLPLKKIKIGLYPPPKKI